MCSRSSTLLIVSSVSPQNLETWLFEMPLIPIGCTSSSTSLWPGKPLIPGNGSASELLSNRLRKFIMPSVIAAFVPGVRSMGVTCTLNRNRDGYRHDSGARRADI